jgi:hypothetical protein
MPGQHLHGASLRARERAELRVLPARTAPAVVARDVRDHLHLEGREAAQLAVLDEVVRVLVVVQVGDVVADVVQEGGVLEEGALGVPQAVPPGRAVEEGQGQLRHLARVLLVPLAALGQAHHAAPAHVRIGLRARQRALVPVDVVEQDSLRAGPIGRG